jgi:hypothetical protein
MKHRYFTASVWCISCFILLIISRFSTIHVSLQQYYSQFNPNIVGTISLKEEKFEDTKRVIRRCKSKDRQCNGQTKKNKSTKHYTEKQRSSNRSPGWTHVLRKGKQFLLQMWHLSCCSCYKPGDKSWMKKGPDCDYNRTYPCSSLTHILRN